jgi:hypothetical protein
MGARRFRGLKFLVALAAVAGVGVFMSGSASAAQPVRVVRS